MRIHILLVLSFLLMSHAFAQSVSLSGLYQGQAQYRISSDGEDNPAAHAVVEFNFKIDPMGKATGSSPKNGCTFLGIATPGSNAIAMDLDLTLKGCHYPDYNRRFKGHLIFDTKTNTTRFELELFLLREKPARRLNINSTLFPMQ